MFNDEVLQEVQQKDDELLNAVKEDRVEDVRRLITTHKNKLWGIYFSQIIGHGQRDDRPCDIHSVLCVSI